MAAAVQRIVVQTTTQDKKSIAAKAKRLDIPISELMRRGAFAYESGEGGCTAAASWGLTAAPTASVTGGPLP